MTFWAKLLIVVVFVWSLIFASMSVVLFGKREDFRSQLKAKSDQYDAEKADWTKKNADLTAKLSQAALETNQAKTVAEETQQRLDSATHEAERKDAEHRALTLSYQDERNLNLKLAADVLIEEVAHAVGRAVIDRRIGVGTHRAIRQRSIYRAMRRQVRIAQEHVDL